MLPLLNRAIASSSTDPRFLGEFAHLASTEPHALVGACVQCASMDDKQAELMFQLLVLSPALVSVQAVAEKHPVLLCHLRDQLDRAAQLTGGRQDALLLFAARLTQITTADAAPLVERDALLAACVLPLLQRGASPHIGLPMRVALQLLSGRAEVLTAQQLPSIGAADRPLSTDGLIDLLSTLLRRLEERAHFSAEDMHRLLRCTHASVQILLPRADGASAASVRMREACRGWQALSWRTQLHAWPLVDRLQSLAAASTGAAGSATQARVGVGERLLSWLREAGRPTSHLETLCCLVIAAGAPSIPLRQALPLLLREASGDGGVLLDDGGGLVAALAWGLTQGSPTEWQHGVSKLLPALHACGALADPITPPSLHAPATDSTLPSPTPMPAANAEQQSVRGAHLLLRAFVALTEWDGSLSASDPLHDLSASNRGRLTFAAGLARWLGAAIKASVDPLTAAHLLGVALRAAALCPAAAKERYFVLRYAALRRLVELRVAPTKKAAEDGACASAGGVEHDRCMQALMRNLLAEGAGANVARAEHGDAGDGFVSLAEM